MKPIFTFLRVLFFVLLSQSFLMAQDFMVTITPPDNGQIEVLNGETVVSDGDMVPENTELTINTTPDGGFQLQQIVVNGAAITGNTHIVTEDVTISADFVEAPPLQNFTITITPSENGTFQVLDGETEILDGSQVLENTELTIVTTPNPGYKLSQILINDVPIEGRTYTMIQDITISVEFVEAVNATLTIKRPTNGRMVVEYVKDGEVATETISNTSSVETQIIVDDLSEVKITAVGNLNHSLKNWTDGFIDNVNPQVFIIDGEMTLGAIFGISPILTIPKPSNGQIEITYYKQAELQQITFESTAVEANMQLKVDIGTSVELTAITDADFEFVEWQGDFVDNQETITIPMSQTNVFIEAIFIPAGAEIQVLLNSILAVTNKNNSDILKSAKYTWFKDGKLLSNGSFQYVEVGSPIPTGEYKVDILFPNKTQISLRRSFGIPINVFPNPVAKNQPLTIVSENAKNLTCELYSLTGNKINAQITPIDNGFSISGISAQGTYIVHLKENGHKNIVKIIVQ